MAGINWRKLACVGTPQDHPTAGRRKNLSNRGPTPNVDQLEEILPSGSRLGPPTRVAPGAPGPSDAVVPTAESSKEADWLGTLGLDQAQEYALKIPWTGESKISALMGRGSTHDDDISLSQPDLASFLPERLQPLVQKPTAFPSWNDYADAFSKCSAEEMRKLLHPNKDPKYSTIVRGKNVKLRLDQLLTVLALRTSNTDLFSAIMTHGMGGDYIAHLKQDCGSKRILGDAKCILHGAVLSAMRLYPSHNAGKYARIGTDLFTSYFENIEKIREAALLETKQLNEEFYKPIKVISGIALQQITAKLNDVSPENEAQVFTQVTMQLGIYTGMVFQAAVQYAEKVGKDAKHKAEIVRICADLAIVIVAGVLASHCPPALAVIPAGMTFVSTYVIPFFVPKTDFRTPFINLRGAAKAASLAKVTEPVDKAPPTIAMMQERRFYHGMFFDQWDMIADSCARS